MIMPVDTNQLTLVEGIANLEVTIKIIEIGLDFLNPDYQLLEPTQKWVQTTEFLIDYCRE